MRDRVWKGLLAVLVFYGPKKEQNDQIRPSKVQLKHRSGVVVGSREFPA